mgnify:CR=1 FL=1
MIMTKLKFHSKMKSKEEIQSLLRKRILDSVWGTPKMSKSFRYKESLSYEQNYNNWKHLNDQEYLDINMKPYSEIESKRVFNEQYGNFSVKEKLRETKRSGL